MKRSLLFFFLGLSPAFGSLGYFHTSSANFYPSGHLVLNLGFEEYLSTGPFGAFQGRYYYLPLNLTYALVKNVQLGLTIPLVSVYDARLNQTRNVAIGDFQLDFEFGHDDLEYDFREAFTFRTRIDTGPAIDRNLRFSSTPSDFTIQSSLADYYPLVKKNVDFALGWNFTKEILPNTSVHFNFRYVYELAPDETLTNIFAFNGLDGSTNNTSSVSNLNQFSGSTLSLFGLEKIVGRLFWTTGLDDPWKDKVNDHIELSAAIDTTFNLEYYLFDRRFSFALKPFLEIFYLKRFSEESLFKSNLSITAGVHFRFFSALRYQIAFSHVLWSESRFEYQDAAHMGVTLFF